MYKRTRFNPNQFPKINEWLFPKKTMILISGKAGVGKTTSAHFVQNYLRDNVTPHSYIGSFASGVKAVARMFGWNGEKDAVGRKLLQDIGNFGREYNKDVWINYLMNEISLHIPEELLEVIIVDDWRFPNEAVYYLDRPDVYKIFTINVESPEREILRGTREWKDASETSLNTYKRFSYIVKNLDTLEVLERTVIDVLMDIIEESKQGGKS